MCYKSSRHEKTILTLFFASCEGPFALQLKATMFDKQKLTDQLSIQNKTLKYMMDATLAYINDDHQISKKKDGTI